MRPEDLPPNYLQEKRKSGWVWPYLETTIGIWANGKPSNIGILALGGGEAVLEASMARYLHRNQFKPKITVVDFDVYSGQQPDREVVRMDIFEWLPRASAAFEVVTLMGISFLFQDEGPLYPQLNAEQRQRHSSLLQSYLPQRITAGGIVVVAVPDHVSLMGPMASNGLRFWREVSCGNQDPVYPFSGGNYVHVYMKDL